MFEEEPARKPAAAQKRNLAPLSVDELEACIAELQTEIERVRAEIARKQAHRNAAANFFK